MTDPPPATGDQDSGRDRAATTGAPRWVRVFGIVALVLAVLVVIVLLIGADHGPGRHTPSAEPGGGTAPAGVHTPLADGH